MFWKIIVINVFLPHCVKFASGCCFCQFGNYTIVKSHYMSWQFLLTNIPICVSNVVVEQYVILIIIHFLYKSEDKWLFSLHNIIKLLWFAWDYYCLSNMLPSNIHYRLISAVCGLSNIFTAKSRHVSWIIVFYINICHASATQRSLDIYINQYLQRTIILKLIFSSTAHISYCIINSLVFGKLSASHLKVKIRFWKKCSLVLHYIQCAFFTLQHLLVKYQTIKRTASKSACALT